MPAITQPYALTNGTTADADEVQGNLDAIEEVVEALDEDNIDSNALIAQADIQLYTGAMASAAGPWAQYRLVGSGYLQNVQAVIIGATGFAAGDLTIKKGSTTVATLDMTAAGTTVNANVNLAFADGDILYVYNNAGDTTLRTTMPLGAMVGVKLVRAHGA